MIFGDCLCVLELRWQGIAEDVEYDVVGDSPVVVVMGWQGRHRPYEAVSTRQLVLNSI